MFNLYLIYRKCVRCVSFPVLPGRWENDISLLSSRSAYRRWRSFSSGGRKPWKQVPHWREPDTLRVSIFEVFFVIVSSVSFVSEEKGCDDGDVLGSRLDVFIKKDVFQILLHIMANPDHSASISLLFFWWKQQNCFTLPLGRWFLGLPVWWVPCIDSLDGSTLTVPLQAFTNIGSYSCGKGIPGAFLNQETGIPGYQM